jgi:2-polyprenyl-3-methyl-5-hydroxy-6-metoxy-1,4-benzoquinol methylase
MEKIKCDYCQSGKYDIFQTASDVFTKDKFNLVKCKDCGLVYLNPRPTIDEIGRYYPDKEYFLESKRCVYAYDHQQAYDAKGKGGNLRLSAQRLFAERFFDESKFSSGLKEKLRDFIIAHRFGRLKKTFSKGKILDVGCGDASFLGCLRDLGWQVQGTEVSEVAAQKAKDNDINVFIGDLLDAKYDNESFDVIRLWSVLEHLHEPAKYLKEIYRILKKEGALIIQVPNINSLAFKLLRKNWCALDVPRHLYHFDKAHLKKMVEQAGFKVRDIHTISVGTLTSSCKADKNTFLKAFFFGFEVILNYLGLGDSLVCYAQK